MLHCTFFAGASEANQKKILDDFRSGHINILVATNVAQEGLSVPDCSVVINYERNMDEVETVQAEGSIFNHLNTCYVSKWLIVGRARADAAMVVTIGQADKQVLARYAVNNEKVQLMHQAVDELMKLRAEDLRETMKQLQRGVLEAYEVELRKERELKMRQTEDPAHFRFRCFKCPVIACETKDVRLVGGAHHMVVDPTFSDRVKFVDKPTLEYMGMECYKNAKMYCKECGQDWGVRVQMERHFELPCLKGGSFLYEDRRTSGRAKHFRKWDELEINFEEESAEDVVRLMLDAKNDDEEATNDL